MTDIRKITDDDLVTYSRTMATGFDAHLSDTEIEQRRPTIDVDRTHAAFDGDAMVGTARSFPTELTVPGGATIDVGAVTNVTVMPTHRRRGALTGMMQAQLDDIASRGESMAILIASESTIYGRFGYGPASWNVTVEVETSRGRFAEPAKDQSLRVVERDEMRRVAPGIYERFRVQQHGAIGRGEWTWDVLLGVIETRYNEPVRKGFHVLHADGYLVYGVDDKWEDRHPLSTLNVLELVALTSEAYDSLWRFAIGHDLKARVVAEDRPEVEPLPLLLADPRRVRQRGRSDFLWVRLLDVPAALAARTYGADDRLVLEVVDRFRPAGGGRFRLDGGDRSCVATTDDPDLTIETRDLGAAYLGGTPLWPAVVAGRLQEHTPGAVERADLLFRTTSPPWCNTWF